ncbi:MAG: inositol monophosphatase family protein [Acidimicrobiales bacterium]
MNVDPTELRLLAVHAATTTAAMVRDRIGDTGSVHVKSSGTDLVTEVDRAAEELVTTLVLAARPDDGVVGEEGGAVTGTSGVRWIVDPIDGTTNFVYGHPGFAVSIAAEHEGRVVAAAVSDPLRAETFAAARGHGAALDGRPITVRAAVPLDRALVATGFSYDRGRRLEQGRVVAELLGHVRDIRRVGAASLDLCWVACGRVDAYFERGLNLWDYAAGALIATEAGAAVSGLHEPDPSPAYLVASTAQMAPGLLSLLRTLEAVTER